jgi:hypothetical protein
MTLIMFGVTGDAPKLNSCCYCVHFPGLFEECKAGTFHGCTMHYKAVSKWTCEAFKSIGAE